MSDLAALTCQELTAVVNNSHDPFICEAVPERWWPACTCGLFGGRLKLTLAVQAEIRRRKEQHG